MEYFSLILKSMLSVIALFFLAKLLGKKQLGQLNMFDYVIGISIGNVVAEMSVNKEVNFVDGLIVMVVYTMISLFVTYLTTKSIWARRFVGGKPVVLMENGKLIEDGLRSVKFDVNDLLEEARINGYFDLSEIEYAIMEANGRVSFLPKSKFQPLTPNDMKMKPAYKGLCSNLVIDGVIMDENLKYISKDAKWLKTRLRNMGYSKVEDLLLVICDSNEKITVYEKGNKKSKEDCFE